MKKFTKIALILVAVFLSIGLVGVIGSFAMGLTWDSLKNMVDDGKLSFDLDDIDDIIDPDEIQHSDAQLQDKEEDGFTSIQENIHSLDVEFGYGTLEIRYGDVEQVQVKQNNVSKYRYYVEEGALHIEGNLNTKVGISKQEGELTIVVPNNMVFQEVDLEFGAGKADIEDLKANQVDVDLGAGEMNITSLDAKELNAQTGAGKLYAELVGKQTDYSYELECGIGQLKIGDSSYTGLGTEQRISNQGAERFAEIECGVGEIVIKFKQ